MLKTKETATPSTMGKRIQHHLVELDKNCQPSDKCLCGYIWDRVFLPLNVMKLSRDMVYEAKR